MEAKHLMLGRGGGMLQVRIKNLVTGGVISETFKASDKFEEAEVINKKIKFIYLHRDKFVFSLAESSSQRFELGDEVVAGSKNYLKSNLELDGVYFAGNIINIKLPPKVDLKVTEAPPTEKGNTAEGGKKPVTTETGLKVQTPFFIREGDTIRVNTKTGEYVERVK